MLYNNTNYRSHSHLSITYKLQYTSHVSLRNLLIYYGKIKRTHVVCLDNLGLNHCFWVHCGQNEVTVCKRILTAVNTCVVLNYQINKLNISIKLFLLFYFGNGNCCLWQWTLLLIAYYNWQCSHSRSLSLSLISPLSRKLLCSFCATGCVEHYTLWLRKFMLVFQSSCSKSCTEYHSHHSPSKRFHILHHFTCFNRYFHAQSDFYVWCPLSYQPTPVSSSMNRTF